VSLETIKENRAKWCEVLRTDKYEQGQSVLRTRDSEFCCLGVAADIFNPGGWSYDKVGGWVHAFRDSGILQNDWALCNLGLTIDDQIILAEANDRGTSFATIATMIEELPVEVSL
jgi:hypothetical protein